jgi:hypothetical protein
VVELRAGFYALPFGQKVWVHLEPDALRWSDRHLVDFVPVAEIRVRGLRTRHRRPGIGAPLAARAVASDPDQKISDRLGTDARTPVTALLRIDDARRQLSEPVLQASLELYSDASQRTVAIDGRAVPLEVESTAGLAWTLSQAPQWRLVRVSHRVVFGTLEAVKEVLAKDGWQINTSFVERLNLDFRQHVAAVGRRVNPLCKHAAGLRQQLVL